MMVAGPELTGSSDGTGIREALSGDGKAQDPASVFTDGIRRRTCARAGALRCARHLVRFEFSLSKAETP